MPRNVLGTELAVLHGPAHRVLPQRVLRAAGAARHARRVLSRDGGVPAVLRRGRQRPQHADAAVRVRGLRAQGSQWCVCAARWAEALAGAAASQVVLESTHLSALEYVDLDDLKAHAATGG